MTRRVSKLRPAVALLTAGCLLIYAAPQLAAQTQDTAAATTTAAAGPDGGWPRGYSTSSGGHLVIYQPQVAGWTGQTHMVAYSAVAFTPKDAAKGELGTIRIEADTSVAMAERLVRFTNFQIAEASFPTLDKDKTREVVTEIDKAFPDDERVIGLDRVLAAVDRSQIVPKNVEGVKADPPEIFFSQTPAVLVNIDGKAIWSPIKDNDLKYAVNTNWDLFQHEPSSSFYLRVESSWLRATDLAGPWTPAASLPESFSKLPDDDNWKDVKAAVPGKSLDPAKTPAVFVSEKPAEIILLDGVPKYAPVPGAGNLVWVSNTESDVFRMGSSGPIYYLVSGRWFTAPDFKGPWIVRNAEPARRVQEDLARASALSRAGLGAGHAAGGRRGTARSGAPDRARQAERDQSTGGRLRRRAEVRADRADLAPARDQYRQGHHQGRRHVLHVLRRSVVHGHQPGGAVASHRLRCQARSTRSR